jgi:hypothetical protein
MSQIVQKLFNAFDVAMEFKFVPGYLGLKNVYNQDDWVV